MDTKIGIGPTDSPRRMQFGDMTVTLLDGGELWLDGGAMFGIIPKPLWSKLVHVDEANRVPLAMTCFLVETGGRRILVETGAGPIEKYDEQERGFFRFADYWIDDSLHAIGVDRASIDTVVMTHLHFDHGGGATVSDGRGGFVPAFPNAKYVTQRGEWEDAVAGHTVMTGTYREENLAPLEAAGVLELADGEAEIAPGVFLMPLPGHTRFQQGVAFRGGGSSAVLAADMLPTAAHVGVRYNMAYDLMPHENMTNKTKLLQESLSKDVTVLLGQDPNHVTWRVEQDSRGRYSLHESK